MEGELELNVYDDCQSEVTFKQRQGRSITTIKADIEFDNGLVDSISFPPAQQIPENNLLKENVLTRQLDTGHFGAFFLTLISLLQNRIANEVW